jgi:iron(III) transport system ATP-binding protein
VLGHRVAILADGEIVQVGPPRELYTRPASRYVAEFMGVANQYEGIVTAVETGVVSVKTDFGSLTSAIDGHSFQTKQRVSIIFRPEHVRLCSGPAPGGQNAWSCVVEGSSFLGFCTEYTVRTNGSRVLVRSMDSDIFEVGTCGWVALDPRNVRLLPLA